MTSKSSTLAFSGMAFLCAVLLSACSNGGASIRAVTITPTSGTIYVSAPPAGAVKGARRGARPAAHAKQKNALSPQDITTASCGSIQFTATAVFSDGTTNSSLSFNWSSSSTGVATVDNTGLATGVALGNTNIGASSQTGIAATVAALEVDQLNSITMNPLSATIASGGSQQFAALGNFTLASGSSAQQDISSQVTWATTNPNLISVDQTGNVTTVGTATGTANVTATSCDGITVGTAAVTVTTPPPPPPSLQISANTNTIAAGTTVQFTAMVLNNGTTTPIPSTDVVTWQAAPASGSSGTVATMDSGNLGVALGVSAGSATITATDTTSGLTGMATLTVTAAAARFAYVANLSGNSGNGSISEYTANVSSTILTPFSPNPAFNTGPGVQQILLHPSGDLTYYIDGGDSLHTLTVTSSSGALATSSVPLQVDSCTASGDTSVGAIDPYGRFIYVVSLAGNCIFGFAITQPNPVSSAPGATTPVGTLTPIPGFGAPNGYTDSTLSSPDWVLIDSTGHYLYVVNSATTGTISQYSIDQTSGVLTPLSTTSPTVPAGNTPLYGSIDVNGHLFVANNGPGTISTYNIGSTGLLQKVGSDVAISGAVSAANVLTDPSGKYLYVVDEGPVPLTNPSGPGQVFAYSYTVGGSGLSLTSVGTSPQPAQFSPEGIAIDPTGAMLIVDNRGMSPGAGSISIYSVGSTGAITPASPANVTADTLTQFVMFYIANSGQ